MTSSLSTAQLKPYLLPLITVVVVVLVVPFAILPWYNDVSTDLNTLSSKNTLKQQMTTKADALEKLDANGNKDLLTNTVEPAIPSEADPPGVLGTLEQLATSAGVSAKSAQFSNGAATAVAPATSASTTTAASGQAGAAQATISVEGNYANILSYITQSETVARVLTIDSLHLVPSTSAGATDVTATLNVSAPYQALVSTLDPIEAPLPSLGGPTQTKTLTQIKSLRRASYAPTTPQSIPGKNDPF